MGLARYHAKRSFSRTPEPVGTVRRPPKGSRSFVIQKHAASRLHYDFRLELEGVLKSWAVPKGIPTSKGDKRLAVHVEDHPLDYASFEGVIPEGNYGAGTVMVWDQGTWESAGDPAEGLRKGKLVFTLSGKKLKGEWTLVRMRSRGDDKDEWLLIKSDADAKPISSRADDQSAVSKRNMAQIAKERTHVWHSNRPAADSTAPRPRSRPAPSVKPAPAAEQGSEALLLRKNPGLPKRTPGFIPPMKAQLIERLPTARQWLLELKLDGIRAIVVKKGTTVELFSRTHRNVTADFRGLAEALRELPVTDAVLDGEIVALDPEGRSSFQLLQNVRRNVNPAPPVCIYLFDLLNLEGRLLLDLPLVERKSVLQALLVNATDPIRFSASLPGKPETALAEIKRRGLEGLIAKDPDSPYQPDSRSGAWVKLKCTSEQEFVIGGYTRPQGSRLHFGAILVGYYDHQQLRFASKVGTGFDTATLRDLYRRFQPLTQSACPFVNLPTKRAGKFGQGITAAEMRRCTWLKPELVAQVRFMEWTADGFLRHPVFLGLREDKPATEVVRETGNSQ